MYTSQWYHTPKTNQYNEQIRSRIIELAHERPRFGTPRLTVLIRQEFGAVNHKRVERLSMYWKGCNYPGNVKKTTLDRTKDSHGTPDRSRAEMVVGFCSRQDHRRPEDSFPECD